jgi:ribosomal protein L20
MPRTKKGNIMRAHRRKLKRKGVYDTLEEELRVGMEKMEKAGYKSAEKSQ